MNGVCSLMQAETGGGGDETGEMREQVAVDGIVE
jgi:hypothetical protein